MKRYVKAAITSDIPEWLRTALTRQLLKMKLDNEGYDIQNSDFVDHVEVGQDYLPIYKIGRDVYIPGVNGTEL